MQAEVIQKLIKRPSIFKEIISKTTKLSFVKRKNSGENEQNSADHEDESCNRYDSLTADQPGL